MPREPASAENNLGRKELTMALRWQWNEKIGELEIAQGEKHFTISCYTGNAMIIMLHEHEERYTLYSFFADKQHFKNCAKEFNYAEDWVKLTLWEKPTNDQWLLIKDLVNRGVEVNLTERPF